MFSKYAENLSVKRHYIGNLFSNASEKCMGVSIHTGSEREYKKKNASLVKC
jgi:hypothetical protein